MIIILLLPLWFAVELMNVHVNNFDVGVAFVVSIDYSGHPGAQLSFTHKDSESLARLFRRISPMRFTVSLTFLRAIFCLVVKA